MTRRLRLAGLTLAFSSFLGASAWADDLLQVYDQALVNDPQIREADATRLATREARPQAIAALLPQASGTASRTRDWSSGTGFSQLVIGNTPQNSPTGGNSVNNTDTWRLQIRQNVFSFANWTTLRAANHIVAQSEADYLAAQQNLAQRVSQQYFAVLSAQDVVEATEAARDAITRQLDQAERRFDVGLIAITDVQEARAARDLAAADAIAAKRALASAQEQLRATIGVKPELLNKPAETMPLLTPEPATPEDWVRVSMDQNAALISSRLAADIARDAVRTAFGGHLPTVDLVAGRSYTDADGYRLLPDGVTQTNSASQGYGKSVSLQFTVPLFSGGATQSRVRQTQYQWIAAKERLERTSRSTEQQARDAFLGVVSEISRVQALRQALESSQTALRATEAGYEVGTRTAVDVLQAQRNLVQARTSYSQSRYAYINNLIQLRLAAGDLDRGVLEEVNRWLTVEAPTPTPNPTPPPL
ncbi:MAG: TolC family outer membrane protein [Steroidobacteraceae bacterium]